MPKPEQKLIIEEIAEDLQVGIAADLIAILNKLGFTSQGIIDSVTQNVWDIILLLENRVDLDFLSKVAQEKIINIRHRYQKDERYNKNFMQDEKSKEAIAQLLREWQLGLLFLLEQLKQIPENFT